MDLSTTPRRATDGVGDIQKTRVSQRGVREAKEVFSIRSLVDVEEAELPAQDVERSPSISYFQGKSKSDRQVNYRVD
ncbi:homeobox protein aristaless-like protein [Lasius niger]|uniref:Homeobox protein aristaless-like protein n=1 Tax=Lasius niger TaxID=67767 RepID=A0A0J7L959_LASNI|nr:homeobox protein aristaless-like protein [Lasius niger]